MVRFCVKSHLQNPGQLKEFSVDGYRFAAEHSSDEEHVFVRCLNVMYRALRMVEMYASEVLPPSCG